MISPETLGKGANTLCLNILVKFKALGARSYFTGARKERAPFSGEGMQVGRRSIWVGARS